VLALLLDPPTPFPHNTHDRSYNGARTSDKFLEFIKTKLEADKGFARVEEMDKVAKDFVAGADKKVRVGVGLCSGVVAGARGGVAGCC
jgi:hypothetical protein